MHKPSMRLKRPQASITYRAHIQAQKSETQAQHCCSAAGDRQDRLGVVPLMQRYVMFDRGAEDLSTEQTRCSTSSKDLNTLAAARRQPMVVCSQEAHTSRCHMHQAAAAPTGERPRLRRCCMAAFQPSEVCDCPPVPAWRSAACWSLAAQHAGLVAGSFHAPPCSGAHASWQEARRIK